MSCAEEAELGSVCMAFGGMTRRGKMRKCVHTLESSNLTH